MATFRYRYAQELRIVGQQLQKQDIDIFDLRYEGGDYVLVCGDPKPPFTDLIHLRYSPLDLKSLEVMAAEGRSAGFKLVEFSDLAEILRAIGRYVERHEAKLSRISVPETLSNDRLFTIEYETRTGSFRAEEMHYKEVEALAMRMYKQRSHIGGSPGQGHSAA